MLMPMLTRAASRPSAGACVHCSARSAFVDCLLSAWRLEVNTQSGSPGQERAHRVPGSSLRSAVMGTRRLCFLKAGVSSSRCCAGRSWEARPCVQWFRRVVMGGGGKRASCLLLRHRSAQETTSPKPQSTRGCGGLQPHVRSLTQARCARPGEIMQRTRTSLFYTSLPDSSSLRRKGHSVQPRSVYLAERAFQISAWCRERVKTVL